MSQKIAAKTSTISYRRNLFLTAKIIEWWCVEAKVRPFVYIAERGIKVTGIKVTVHLIFPPPCHHAAVLSSPKRNARANPGSG